MQCWSTTSLERIFTGPTKCGKTHLVLNLTEKEYNKHFDYTIIICPTLRWNMTYHSKTWIRNDDKVWLIEPKDIICRTLRCICIVFEKVNALYYWTKKLSQLLACSETLFIIDDIIADEILDKRRQSLLELAISGKHRKHYLWLLTQTYSAIPKNVRRRAKAIFVWYPKERTDLKMIHDENDVLTDDELVVVRDFLRTSKHACLYVPNEHPRGFNVLTHVWGDYFLSVYLKINMDKTSQKVTKDPRIQERGKKSYETYMNKIKEKILEELSIPSSTGNSMSSTSISTGNSTPSTPHPPALSSLTSNSTPSTSISTGNSTPSTSSSTNAYVYGIGILAVLAIGVCVQQEGKTSQSWTTY